MKEAAPRTVKLEDYQPPAYLIETVDLAFHLHEQGSRVVSRLGVKRNPKGQGGSLRLHGEGLQPIWVRLDGQEIAAERYRIDAESLTLFEPPDVLQLECGRTLGPMDGISIF